MNTETKRLIYLSTKARLKEILQFGSDLHNLNRAGVYHWSNGDVLEPAAWIASNGGMRWNAVHIV
jgi:hypothetical protein